MIILFLSIGSLNNIKDPGVYTDLLREFQKNGHQVYVVCAREKRWKKPTEYVEEDGVRFLRVKIGNLTKTNFIEKGISTFMVQWHFLKALKRYLGDVRFDLVLYSTPPITFEKVVRYIKKRDGAKSYLLLKDIFPQNAVDLNLFSKRNPLYWYFRWKEKNLYALSDYIGCMSKANMEFLLRKNPEISKERVEICPNSIEPLPLRKDGRRRREIRKKYQIPPDKTVFLYGGNLGKPQGTDFLMKCLEAHKNHPSAYFLIAGSGTEFPKLKGFLEKEKLGNVRLLAQLPAREFEELAMGCDVGLLFLDHRFTVPNFPSRLLSYMQAALPVLAATDVNTDVGRVIEEGRFGFWCESKRVEDFHRLVQKISDPGIRKQMGNNARQYLETHFTVKRSYAIIMNHFSMK